MRLLFARLGTQFCPDCQVPVEAQTRDQLARRLLAEAKQRGDLILLAPVVKNRKGFHTEVAEWAARHGYAEVRADGKMHPTSERLRLDRFREHDVEIVTGVLEARARKAEKGLPSPQELIDETLRVGHGTLLALDPRGQVTVHSTERACTHCGGRSRRWTRRFSVTILRKAGARSAAVSANCFTCRTWIAARAQTPSRNRGSNGRRANASCVRRVTARG